MAKYHVVVALYEGEGLDVTFERENEDLTLMAEHTVRGFKFGGEEYTKQLSINLPDKLWIVPINNVVALTLEKLE